MPVTRLPRSRISHVAGSYSRCTKSKPVTSIYCTVDPYSSVFSSGQTEQILRTPVRRPDRGSDGASRDIPSDSEVKIWPSGGWAPPPVYVRGGLERGTAPVREIYRDSQFTMTTPSTTPRCRHLACTAEDTDASQAVDVRRRPYFFRLNSAR